MDIKEKINEIVAKVKADPALASNFKKDPEGTIEKIAGVDIPDGAMSAVIAGVKAKLGDGAVGGVFKKLF